MNKYLLLSVSSEESMLAVVEDEILNDLIIEDNSSEEVAGEIYVGIVKNVVNSINGVFLDIGGGKNAYLRYDDIINRDTLPTEGETLLVQIKKESTYTKGPLVTEKISFKGKYAVLIKGTNYIGVSKKIHDEDLREKFRNITKTILPEGYGAIIRTESIETSVESFLKELKKLIYESDVVQKRFKREKNTGLLYRNSDLSMRCIRDYLDKDVKKLLIDDKSTYNRMNKLISEYFPEYSKTITFYNEKKPLFEVFNIEDEIQKLYKRKIELKSGGSIIFDYAEALTVIDVNSGSFNKNMSHEDVAFFVNKEAACEIARQLRLRGIGGIIMIDFIDMKDLKRREQLIGYLKKELKKDFVKTVICGMTSLGLVEMTRERTVHSLLYKYYDDCSDCGGVGKVFTLKRISNKIHKDLEFMRKTGNSSFDLTIECQVEVANYLRKYIDLWEKECGKKIFIKENKSLYRDVYSILLNKD